MTFLMGASAVEITPPFPVPLAGFATRQGSFNSVHAPLMLRAYWMEARQQASLLLTADLIWWDEKLVQAWRNKIHQLYDMPEEAILFHATHNHSGPQISDQFTALLGSRDDSYIAQLETRVFACIAQAKANKEPVTCKYKSTNCELGIYRRQWVEGRVTMAPNADHPCDSEVKLFVFEDMRQQAKAIWIHYACHPTCTDANDINAEYIGYACSRIETYYDQAVVGFLQGCAGDIRPAFIRDQAFYKGTIGEMELFGECFSSIVLEALEALASEAEGTSFVSLDRIQALIERVPLPFQTDYSPPAHLLETPELVEQWHQYVANYWGTTTETILEIHALQIGPYSFIAFSGEMVQAYGAALKQLGNDVVPLGYSNGMTGYIPTAQQLSEGGYEAEDFIFYFGLPAPFQPSIEKTIYRTVNELLLRLSPSSDQGKEE